MEPFYFGRQTEIFGIYHEANPERHANLGVVLLYPFGQEYIRCHKAYVILSRKLAAVGIDVLRFDFTGCGDSRLDPDNVNWSQWMDNISTAIDELKQGSGVTKIVLAGCRLGAAMALMAGATHAIDGYVLWYPVLNGKDYLAEISQTHKEWVQGSFAKIKPADGYYEFHGFRFPQSLVNEIARLDLLHKAILPGTKGMVLDQTNNSSTNAFFSKAPQMTFVESTLNHFWLKGTGENAKEKIPVKDIELITNWLEAFASTHP